MINTDWNRRLLGVLHKTQITEVGLLASFDVQAALDYESRLQDYKNQIKKEEAAAAGHTA